MNQVVQLVTERTGISEDKAQQAVETVVGWLKEQLPAGLGSQLDSVIDGKGGGQAGGGIGGMAGGLGGMLGGDRRT